MVSKLLNKINSSHCMLQYSGTSKLVDTIGTQHFVLCSPLSEVVYILFCPFWGGLSYIGVSFIRDFTVSTCAVLKDNVMFDAVNLCNLTNLAIDNCL